MPMLESCTTDTNRSFPEGQGLEAHEAISTLALTGMRSVHNDQWPMGHQV